MYDSGGSVFFTGPIYIYILSLIYLSSAPRENAFRKKTEINDVFTRQTEELPMTTSQSTDQIANLIFA